MRWIQWISLLFGENSTIFQAIKQNAIHEIVLILPSQLVLR